jgi:hypothetical protein
MALRDRPRLSQLLQPDRKLFNLIEQFAPFYPATPQSEMPRKQLHQTTTGASQ